MIQIFLIALKWQQYCKVVIGNFRFRYRFRPKFWFQYENLKDDEDDDQFADANQKPEDLDYSKNERYTLLE